MEALCLKTDNVPHKIPKIAARDRIRPYLPTRRPEIPLQSASATLFAALCYPVRRKANTRPSVVGLEHASARAPARSVGLEHVSVKVKRGSHPGCEILGVGISSGNGTLKEVAGVNVGLAHFNGY
jgi:hypothetical protein